MGVPFLGRFGFVNFFFYSAALGVACQCGDVSDLSSVAPDLLIAPAELDFGDVTISEFRYRSLDLSNPGSSALEIVQIQIESPSTEFRMESDVITVIPPKSTVQLLFRYDPTDIGEDLGTLNIETKDSRVGTKMLAIRGRGISRGFSLNFNGPQCDQNSSSLSFGEVAPGQSKTLDFTLTATGEGEVNIQGIALSMSSSAEFSLGQNSMAASVISAGDALQIQISYAPIDAGPDSGTLIMMTDVADSPIISIGLCGLGDGPALCARPNPLDFGTSAPSAAVSKILTLENCGTQDLTIQSAALSSDAQHPTNAGFSLSNPITVAQVLAPSATTDLDLSFKSAQVARAQGFVHVASDSLGQPDSFFALQAEVGQPCDLSIIPAAVNFSNVAVGASLESSILLANDGATSCLISDMNISAGSGFFAIVNRPALPHVIAAGASYVLTLRFTAVSASPEMGELSIVESGVSQTVPLTGNPMLADGCQLDVHPLFLSFGVVTPGSTTTLVVDVVNISDDFCTIRSVQLGSGTSADFVNTSANFGLVLPGRSKQLSVTYRPQASGSTARGTLNIRTSDVDTPDFQVALAGACGETGICVSPRHLPFGNTNVADMMNVNIYACGSTDVTVNALDWTVPDGELILLSPPTLPFTLRSGDMQSVTVRYAPVDMISEEAELTVRSNDLVNPNIAVRVTGGPEVVPAEAGRFLYYWQIQNPIAGGDIMQLPLQGQTTARPYWGPRVGKSCTGCHEVSPDGRYVALIEIPSFKVIDTSNDQALTLPSSLVSAEYLSWNPNVNTNPPYQFAYAAGGKIHIGAIFQGHLRELQGANNVADNNSMPSWGSNGSIAVVRGQVLNNTNNGGSGFSGPTDLYLVPENGGTAQRLAGASNNGFGNYYPRFSPNGQWIAFTESRAAMSTIAASDAKIRLVKSDHSGVTQSLSTLNGPSSSASSYPTWSVNGAFLSFSSNRPGGQGDWDIWMAPIDPLTGVDSPASNVVEANTPQFEHAAQWSP